MRSATDRGSDPALRQAPSRADSIPSAEAWVHAGHQFERRDGAASQRSQVRTGQRCMLASADRARAVRVARRRGASTGAERTARVVVARPPRERKFDTRPATNRSIRTSYKERPSMTLHQYLDLTASTSGVDLRRAMATALGVEAAHTPDAYARYYDRVIDALCRETRPPGLQTSPLWAPMGPCQRSANTAAVHGHV